MTGGTGGIPLVSTQGPPLTIRRGGKDGDDHDLPEIFPFSEYFAQETSFLCGNLITGLPFQGTRKGFL